jgi:hypothetical protein
MGSNPIVILENSAFFNKGQVINEYKQDEDGILVGEAFIPEGKYVILHEHLTNEDEKKIKELIRAQLKFLLWNLYSKQSTLIGNY